MNNYFILHVKKNGRFRLFAFETEKSFVELTVDLIVRRLDIDDWEDGDSFECFEAESVLGDLDFSNITSLKEFGDHKKRSFNLVKHLKEVAEIDPDDDHLISTFQDLPKNLPDFGERRKRSFNLVKHLKEVAEIDPDDDDGHSDKVDFARELLDRMGEEWTPPEKPAVEFDDINFEGDHGWAWVCPSCVSKHRLDKHYEVVDGIQPDQACLVKGCNNITSDIVYLWDTRTLDKNKYVLFRKGENSLNQRRETDWVPVAIVEADSVAKASLIGNRGSGPNKPMAKIIASAMDCNFWDNQTAKAVPYSKVRDCHIEEIYKSQELKNRHYLS